MASGGPISTPLQRERFEPWCKSGRVAVVPHRCDVDADARKARPPIADDVVDEDAEAEAIKDRVEKDAAIIVVLFTETTRLLCFVCPAVSVPSVYTDA